MKSFLCKEYNESFIIEAANIEAAELEAQGWGGVVIREVEILGKNPNGSLNFK